MPWGGRGGRLTDPHGVCSRAALGGTFLSHLSTRATVGEALVAAKEAATDSDVRKSYLLFGDPSMRVRR